jgi:hypothetical protein
MPYGFELENNLQIFGDGKGNIIIEEWSDNDLTDLIGKVKISLARFEQICDVFRKELETEAIQGDLLMFDSGFDKFWAAWPANPRKGEKSACKTKWEKTYCETQADQIVKHVTWMKTTEQWLKANGAFIPAPLVYLNQQRWDGSEVPEMALKNRS